MGDAGGGRWKVAIVSLTVDAMVYLPGFFFREEGFRGGGCAESLSEIDRREARLVAPRPLDCSSRCLACERSIEWSLEKSDRVALL